MLKTITQTKICSKCKSQKDISFFDKQAHGKYGVRGSCKACISLFSKNRYETKKDQIKEYSREYKQRNREYCLQYCIKYNLKHKDKLLIYAKQYVKTDIGKASKANCDHKRRLKTKKGDVSAQQLIELRQNAKVCYWCGISLKKVKVHIDHYIPISKGGDHTLSNLVISCQKCNNKKSSKDPIQFANSIGKLI